MVSAFNRRTTAIMRYAVQSGLIDYNPAQEMAGAVASSNRQHRPALELSRLAWEIENTLPRLCYAVLSISVSILGDSVWIKILDIVNDGSLLL